MLPFKTSLQLLHDLQATSNHTKQLSRFSAFAVTSNVREQIKMSTFNNYDETAASNNDGRRPAGVDVIAAFLYLYCRKQFQTRTSPKRRSVLLESAFTLSSMSTFHNYDETAASYNDGRRPAGVDVIAAFLHLYSRKQFQKLHVLDAGCGTGNYGKVLLDMGIGRVTMFDASEEMMKYARNKVGNNNKVTFQQGLLPDLPFEDNTFDVVMFNMVLHHLDKDGTANHFPKIKLALREAHRVLKPCGLLTISTCFPETNQLYWFTHLNKAITEKYLRKIPSKLVWTDILKEAQITIKSAVSIMGSDWFDQYHDVEGPLRKEWREKDSYWSVATEDELREVEKRVKKLKEEGKLQDFKKGHDGTETFGHIIFIFAVKS